MDVIFDSISVYKGSKMLFANAVSVYKMSNVRDCRAGEPVSSNDAFGSDARDTVEREKKPQYSVHVRYGLRLKVSFLINLVRNAQSGPACPRCRNAVRQSGILRQIICVIRLSDSTVLGVS